MTFLEHVKDFLTSLKYVSNEELSYEQNNEQNIAFKDLINKTNYYFLQKLP